MRINNGLALLLVFMGIGLSLVEGMTQDNPTSQEGKTLIRKDLLFQGKEQLELPLRNIFSPITSRRAQVGTAVIQEKRSENPVDKQQDQAAERKEPPRPVLNVRYIGYVRSKEKIVALILFRGIAYAVEEGELLEEQVEVKDITVEEIVLTLAGFQLFKYAIEGETR
jgi:hypothetical protein